MPKKSRRRAGKAVTIIIKQPAAADFFAVWVQTTACNFPMALCWQIFYAGPLVRLIFRMLFVYWRKPKAVLSATASEDVVRSETALADSTSSARSEATCAEDATAASETIHAASEPSSLSDKRTNGSN